MSPSAELLVSSSPNSGRTLLALQSVHRPHGLSSKPQGKPVRRSSLRITDIRRNEVTVSLKKDILAAFSPAKGPRTLPTLLLYDKKGLQLFEEITYLDEYYLTNREIAILEASAAAIAAEIPQGSMIIELGSGNLRKVNLLLQALETAGKNVEYYALDLSRDELDRTLAQLPLYEHVSCHGLLGTYDDGREWLKTPAVARRQKCILTLGSSIGNFTKAEAATFLRGFADVLGPEDAVLVGLDSCANPSKVYHAYNDSQGVTHRFVLNGLAHANAILGHEAFRLADWHVIGEYVHDADGGRHNAYVAPVRRTTALGHAIEPHERVHIEQSRKFSAREADELWCRAGLAEVAKWQVASKEQGLYMLAKTKMPFSLNPPAYAMSTLPSVADWEATWEAWDIVTRRMLPDELMLEKPIKLRNACIFYLGHIPTFLDIQLNKTTGAPLTEPTSYSNIFERGIDPDVDNPALCHAHSEIPDEWPLLDDVLAYQQRVRHRVRALYKSDHSSGHGLLEKAGAGALEKDFGRVAMTRPVARAVWIGFEHELMHLETLLYMMLQSDKILPPPGVRKPDFARLAAEARGSRVPNQWFDIPAQSLTIGLDDPEGETDLSRNFGWDNEKPARGVRVHAFQAMGRAITNEDYARFMLSTNVALVPASWVNVDKSRAEGCASVYTNGHSDSNANGKAHGTKRHTVGRSGDSHGRTNGYSNGSDSDRCQSITAATPEKPLPRTYLRGKAVRTVFGLVPLEHALDWPVFASYDELSACAAWLGGRIPTFEEARSIYEHVNVTRRDSRAQRQLNKTVPAVNGHLCNNGVQETPPAASATSGGAGAKLDDLFVDLGGANVGFQHWHPTPVTAAGGRLAGQGELGGVWEWTSSPLRPHAGFEPMPQYPGYTADFFDEKHNIVLGGSWATHPRIAGRKSFVNWYQRNYPYAWVGARLVRDL